MDVSVDASEDVIIRKESDVEERIARQMCATPPSVRRSLVAPGAPMKRRKLSNN
jgi:hypothetical protein